MKLKDDGADQRDRCGEMQHAHGDQRVDQPVLQLLAVLGAPCVHLLTDPKRKIPFRRVGVNRENLPVHPVGPGGNDLTPTRMTVPDTLAPLLTTAPMHSSPGHC